MIMLSVLFQVPCNPIDVAAHLKLLGDSLQTIGFRLQEHKVTKAYTLIWPHAHTHTHTHTRVYYNNNNFQTLHYCLSNSFFWRTFISTFHVFSNTQAQIAPFIWFSLVVCSQGENSCCNSCFFGCCPYSLNMLRYQRA